MLRKWIIIAVFALLLPGVEAQRASADLVDLVYNGGFETGDFTGWTLTAVSDTDFVYVTDTAPHTGTYAADLGKSDSPGIISQAIVTTAGRSYLVTFSLANDLAGTNSFQALWNGRVMNPNLVNSPAFDYREYSFTGIADGATSTLAFAFRHDASTFHLDNVSSAPVPLPGTLLLLGSGVTGLLGISMRRRTEAYPTNP